MIELMRDRITIQKSSVKQIRSETMRQSGKMCIPVLLMPITCQEKNTGQQSS